MTENHHNDDSTNCLPVRKRIRLDADNYRGGDTFFLTICSEGKKDIFLEEPVIGSLCSVLEISKADNGGPVHAYVIMPDHLHLLIGGSKDVVQWVAWFKGRVSFLSRKAGWNGTIWQRSFHDHGVRKTENVNEILSYMRDNPVSAGLVDDGAAWKWRYGC
jgi:REP element-mobilizing transposase RayT